MPVIANIARRKSEETRGRAACSPEPPTTLLSPRAVDQFPSFREVSAKLIITDLVEVDSYPALASNVRWPVVDAWEAGNESLLLSWLCRDHNRDMAVVVVIVGEHRKDTLLNKKRRLTMGGFLARARQRQANPADSL